MYRVKERFKPLFFFHTSIIYDYIFLSHRMVVDMFAPQTQATFLFSSFQRMNGQGGSHTSNIIICTI